ncbi:MAG: 3-deoxy-8-phosphooctulonate synthase [Candidatus Omnitrophica bacterium CG1_02_49_16]|nr:MAG: 3-deoxy-8-phosphooctulonate synthase [Candidatus Omnitrophica bacterium CG1_02_49_16]
MRVGRVTIGGGRPLVLIAGPCVIESQKSALRHARAIKKIARRLGIPVIYKSSYDKANRSSIESFRGPGIDQGLMILKRVKEETGLPILTDIHRPQEAAPAAGVADILQIPAFLCRQTDLVTAAARTGKAVNVKKGQFLAPWDMGNIVHKIETAGNRKILLTERGTSFGYNTLITDFRAIAIMKDLGYPVIFDATHSVQQPGGRGASSGGERRFVPVLAQAAAAVGVDGIFMEVHENPDQAPSDGPNMVPLKDLERLLERLMRINRAVKNAD